MCQALSSACDKGGGGPSHEVFATKYAAENVPSLLMPLLTFLRTDDMASQPSTVKRKSRMERGTPSRSRSPPPMPPALPRAGSSPAYYQMLAKEEATVLVVYRPPKPEHGLDFTGDSRAQRFGLFRCLRFIPGTKKPPPPKATKKKRKMKRSGERDGYALDDFVVPDEEASDSDSASYCTDTYTPDSSSDDVEIIDDDDVPLVANLPSLIGAEMEGLWFYTAESVARGEVDDGEVEVYPFLERMRQNEVVELLGEKHTIRVRDIRFPVSVNGDHASLIRPECGPPMEFWMRYTHKGGKTQSIPRKQWGASMERLCKSDAIVTRPVVEEEEEEEEFQPKRSRREVKRRKQVESDSEEEEEEPVPRPRVQVVMTLPCFPGSRSPAVKALRPPLSASDEKHDLHNDGVKILDGFNSLSQSHPSNSAVFACARDIHSVLHTVKEFGEIEGLITSFVPGKHTSHDFGWRIINQGIKRFVFNMYAIAPADDDCVLTVLGDGWMQYDDFEGPYTLCYACQVKKCVAYSMQAPPQWDRSTTPSLGIHCADGIAGATILLAAVRAAAVRWRPATLEQRYELAKEVVVAIELAKEVFARRAKRNFAKKMDKS